MAWWWCLAAVVVLEKSYDRPERLIEIIPVDAIGQQRGSQLPLGILIGRPDD